MSRSPARSATRGLDLLSSAVRRRIVEHLLALPTTDAEGRPGRAVGLTAGELGDVLGLHPTTVRFHLDQLVEAGILSVQTLRRGGVGRPAKCYAAVEAEAEALPLVRAHSEGPYRVLASLLVEALDPMTRGTQSPEAAGRAWARERLAERADAEPAHSQGEWLGKVGGIVDLLAEWGYRPDVSVDGRDGDVTLALTECPFLELAKAHPAVVCGVHRGLLKGALGMVGEPQAGVSLRPFVGEQTCHALFIRHARPSTSTAESPSHAAGTPAPLPIPIKEIRP